ncbi:MAG: lysophospholipid acyltransferase family protein [Halanaerobium sp.]
MKNFIYHFISRTLYLIFKIFYKIKVTGRDNLPKSGGVIVMSNHISGYDPPLLAAVFKRPLRFMAKKELFEKPIMRFVLYLADAFPVDRDKRDIKAVKKALKVLKDGQVLGLFPEGTRRPEGKPGQLRPGSVMLAVKSGVPILPVGIKNVKSEGRITVNIGEKFSMEKFSKKKLTKKERKEAAEYIKEKIVKQINY